MLMMTLLPAYVLLLLIIVPFKIKKSLVRSPHHRWTRYQPASHSVFPALRALIVQYFTSGALTTVVVPSFLWNLR